MTPTPMRAEIIGSNRASDEGMVTSGELVRYDAACRALAEAKSIDEVKEIRNQASLLPPTRAKPRTGALKPMPWKSACAQRGGSINSDRRKRKRGD
jgi:hypothetical protein